MSSWTEALTFSDPETSTAEFAAIEIEPLLNVNADTVSSGATPLVAPPWVNCQVPASTATFALGARRIAPEVAFPPNATVPPWTTTVEGRVSDVSAIVAVLSSSGRISVRLSWPSVTVPVLRGKNGAVENPPLLRLS